ncbi:indole-diterpene biosynthesis protein PaxU [Aspergillus costaricaensis CBS 115574]|uniref:Indole-diterpene biosynthesis protein PaxU n=1 Tax=Aspergillus costaricaensis CBS 115574 TaxID=1448317 RepID=A0ACD1IMN0_9EURO|nr:indole-diterpene biosynthesis protein PaxU [Aspergillus costaricaensis CBS 115574]RAK91629.1 indole-diterpene biosynthesis protein PaxU [Aspergillus costaricaensis CBS 115574]
MSSQPTIDMTPLPKPITLSPTIHAYDPLTPESTSTSNAPQTIILAYWMNAPQRALTKYTTQYRTLYPRARILTLQSSTGDFMRLPSLLSSFTSTSNNNNSNKNKNPTQPALDYLLLHHPPTNTSERIHIHLFSNGGVYTTTTLLSSYKTTTGHPLPITSLLIDSAPGKPSLVGAFRAFSFGLPKNVILKWVGRLLLGCMLLVMFGVRLVVGSEDGVSKGRRLLNDKSVVGERVRRCYVYSEGDGLVEWRDVEEHAREAERVFGDDDGGGLVRREKWGRGSGHVEHMRVDGRRYWRVVGEIIEDTI